MAPPPDLLKNYRRHGQEHVFEFWDTLSPLEQERFEKELRSVDLELLVELAAETGGQTYDPDASDAMTPAPVLCLTEESTQTERESVEKSAWDALRSGHIGLIMVAGGQGSRLGIKGPKGKVAFGPLSQRSFFQWHAEAILRSLERTCPHDSPRGGPALPWYIMTSPENDAETRQFFETNHYFGLPSDGVRFFSQGTLPALDRDGKLLLREPGRLFQSPNGHGGVFEAFLKGGCLKHARETGVRYLSTFQVDNPLVHQFDPMFIGHHIGHGADMSLKVVHKVGLEERIGIVAEAKGKPLVVEYSDLSDTQASARDANGELRFWAGSIAIHIFSTSFFARVCHGEISLPYHRTFRNVTVVDSRGEPTLVEASKFERFVFDALPAAERYLNLEVERSREFAPVKSPTGVDSLESAHALVEAEHRRWVAACGARVAGRVEVSPRIAGWAAELRERWKPSRREFPGDLRLELGEDGGIVEVCG